MSTVVIGGDLSNGGGGAENAGGNDYGTSTSGGAQAAGGAEPGGNGPGGAPSCFDPNAPQDYADVPLVPYQGRCSAAQASAILDACLAEPADPALCQAAREAAPDCALCMNLGLPGSGPVTWQPVFLTTGGWYWANNEACQSVVGNHPSCVPPATAVRYCYMRMCEPCLVEGQSSDVIDQCFAVAAEACGGSQLTPECHDIVYGPHEGPCYEGDPKTVFMNTTAALCGPF